uniref:J domain-containing protein n=1 Tax=Elaeophora elaphi TaxID=1147741 RepID=A0A0R3S5Z3_9BILA
MQHAVNGTNEYDRPDYYAILGCNRCSTTSQIMADYRKRIRQLHPDKSFKQVPEIFYELQKAKNILTDDEMRRTYDAWLNCSINIPWSLWLENSHSLSGIHWTSRVHNPAMLKYRNEETEMGNLYVGSTSRQTSSYHSLLLKKFRNYEI